MVFEINLDSSGSANYSVSYSKRPVILLSELGLNGWDNNFVQAGVSFNVSDTVWRPVYGERRLVRDNYNSMTVTLLKEGRPRDGMQIEVRAYNEGVAFRYYFHEHQDGGRDIHIREERTGFTMPVGTKAWFTPRAQGRYSLLPLENWPGESERPLVLELSNGLYVCLAEAEMVDYSRTRFALHREKPNTIICSMYGAVDLTRPFGTPWRVIMAADDPGRFIENNDIILNLNPPNRIANTSWIKPGKVMRETTLSAKGAREIVDFAVKRNLQYIHFDAGWYGYEYIAGSDATTVTVDPRRNPESDLDIQKAIRYADENGIGVILYVNQRALFRQIDELLPLFKKWGVRGIKFGFVHVGSHRWTTWMHDAVKKCADYNMLVNIHDEYRPTGFSRTWPNLMTQEGIYGNEEMPDATHNTVLPFTRFIAGAADYTVCYYHRPEFKESLRKSQSPRILKTTSAHQLALPVIYYSPLQYMYWYDRPSDSHDEPELEFFDRVPVVWDETRVLHGEIGKYITIARRDGDEWFIGTITNNDEREVKIPLDFLEEGRNYEASVYFDDPGSGTRTKVGIRRIRVDATSLIDTRLYGSGGQAVWIRPEN
jgi:alpha-glucosidase